MGAIAGVGDAAHIRRTWKNNTAHKNEPSFHSMRMELDCVENATLHVNSHLAASLVAKHTHGYTLA